MACKDLVAQCFMDERTPLAVSELKRERTLKNLECSYRQGLSWDDAKQQIQAFLQERGVPIRVWSDSGSWPDHLFSLGWVETEPTSKPLHQLRRCHDGLRIKHLLSGIIASYPPLVGRPANPFRLGR